MSHTPCFAHKTRSTRVRWTRRAERLAATAAVAAGALTAAAAPCRADEPRAPVQYEVLASVPLPTDERTIVYETHGFAATPAVAVLDAKIELEADAPAEDSTATWQLELRRNDSLGAERVLDRTRLRAAVAIVPLTVGCADEVAGEFHYQLVVTPQGGRATLAGGWFRLRLVADSAVQGDVHEPQDAPGDDARGDAGNGDVAIRFARPVRIESDDSRAFVVRRPNSLESALWVDTTNSLLASTGLLALTQWETVSRKFFTHDALDDPYGRFNLSFSWAGNAGSERPNRAWTWGYNQTPDGGNREIPEEPALCWRLESFYSPAPGEEYMEPMLQYVDRNGQIFRPLGWRIDRNSGEIVAGQRFDSMSYLDRATGRQFFKAQMGSFQFLEDTVLVSFSPNRPFIKQYSDRSGAMVDLVHLENDDVHIGQDGYGVRLNGGRLGFFGAPPVGRPQSPAALLDQSGGQADGTIAPVSGADPAINDNFAELSAQVEQMRAALVELGLLADAP